jgi:uncharacterized protein
VTLLLAALFAVGLLAFATEAAIGFGSTLLAVTLGSHLVGLDELLPAFVPLNMVISIALLVRHRHRVDVRLLVREVAPWLAAGAALGLLLFRLPARDAIEMAFGLGVTTLAAIELSHAGRADAARPLPTATGRAFLTGGGVAHGVFGAGGPLIVYVLRRRLGDKGAFRASLAAVWLALNATLIVNYASLGLFTADTLIYGGAIGAAVLPGYVVGERLHRALPADRFWRLVCVVLLAAGLSLAVRAALAL